MTLPVVKHSYLITDINDIPRIIKEAFYIAQTGRPGPVLIDLPKNVQQARTQPVFPKEVQLRGYNPDKRASDLELNEIIGLIEKSERPVLYVGGGIITGNASEELRRFAEAAQIPVTTHADGLRGVSGDASTVIALARHARRGVRELGGERRVRAAQERHRADETHRARSRSAAGVRRAVR